MAPRIFHRQESSASTKYYTIGIIAGSVGLIVLLCLLYLFCSYRSKANKKRIARQSTGSFRVKGVVRPMMAECNTLSKSESPLSRQRFTASIVMPEKPITRKPTSYGLSDKAVVSFQLEPSPASSPASSPKFCQSPPSNASFSTSRPRVMSVLNSPCSQHSRSSSGFSAFAQHPFPPGLNSRPSSVISTSPSQVKPVRQLFVPSLPDELALVRYGERLTVFRSFDDGWCLVTRDTTRSSWISPPPIWKTNSGDNVDIGLVPAWVFIKPLKGITVTRPFRNESINALHLGQNWAPSPTRDAVVSWSFVAL